MPYSPTLADRLAQATVDLYSDAEAALLERIAKSLAAGVDAPGWAETQLIAVQRYRVQAEALLAQLQVAAGQSIAEAVLVAYNRGQAVASGDLAALLDTAVGTVVDPLPGSAAVSVLARETVGTVTSTHRRILRQTTDVYRDVIAKASGRVLAGAQTQREAAQTALDQFAKRGVTGFVDRAGRSWDMTSYVEMAVRTSTANAALAAHTEKLTKAGVDLVIVSDAPQECKLCRPFEGKVLSLSGGVVGVIEMPSVVGGRAVRVNVLTSLRQARAAGLFHPGCRHSVSAYLPGATRIPVATEDPQGDLDRQRLRYLERQTRAWKRTEAAAMDAAARKAARQRVKAYQAAIRTHVATTSAKRQPHRERLNSAR